MNQEPDLSVYAAAKESPEEIALIQQDSKTGEKIELSFRQLAELVAARCAQLISGSSGKDTIVSEKHRSRPVGFVASNDVATVVLILALLELKVPILPLNPRLTKPERRALLKSSGAAEIELVQGGEVCWQTTELVQKHSDNGIPGAATASAFLSDLHWIRITDSNDQLTQIVKSESDERKVAGKSYTPPAVLIATSGTSSGSPKLACLSLKALLASARTSAEHLGWHSGDKWLLSLSLAHIGGFSILVRCLLARRPMVIAEPGLPSELLVELVEINKVTLVSLVPTQLERLLSISMLQTNSRQSISQRMSSLRAAIIGGARASAELINRARRNGIPALTTYGMSETASQVALQPLLDLKSTSAAGDSGIALSNVEMRSIDNVLQMRGPMLFDGYLEKKGEDYNVVGGTDREGWFTTNDIGSIDSDGRLFIWGRSIETIITGGEKVSPGEVEAALEACPSIKAAVVFGVESADIWGELVAAAVVLRDNQSEKSDLEIARNVAAFAASRLASFKRPRRIAIMPNLVLGPTGKIDRRAVIAEAKLRLLVL